MSLLCEYTVTAIYILAICSDSGWPPLNVPMVTLTIGLHENKDCHRMHLAYAGKRTTYCNHKVPSRGTVTV